MGIHDRHKTAQLMIHIIGSYNLDILFVFFNDWSENDEDEICSSCLCDRAVGLLLLDPPSGLELADTLPAESCKYT